MRVILDGKTLPEAPAGETLQQVLENLQEQWLHDDRVIQELKIDGQPYRLEAQGPADLVPVARIESLEVVTLGPRELALHFLGQAPAVLGKLRAALPRMAEMFRAGDEAEASEHYGDFLETLRLFMQMVGLSQEALELDFETISSAGATAQDHVERLRKLIGDLLRAQEQQDYVLLADLLLYDLRPELDAWEELCAVLRERSQS